MWKASSLASSCSTARRSPRSSWATITKWDDEAIKKLNPKAKLPSSAIAVVHRSDGSGTTFNFTNYLNKVSPEWKDKVGSDASVEWPVGIGAKGNEGVANNVAQTKGSIGYVEYAYAKQNKMTYTNMVNKDGKTVAPELKSFQAAAASADWKSVPGFGVILTDQAGADSWPIDRGHLHPDAASAGQMPSDSTVALKFFDWAYKQGRQDGRGARLHPDARRGRRARARGRGRTSRTRLASPCLR